MLMVLIVVGLLAAGAVIAIGGLHWRGLVRFGRRGSGWGIGTMILGLLQAAAWLALPGEPAIWLRLLIALLGAVLLIAWFLWRRSTVGSAQ